MWPGTRVRGVFRVRVTSCGPAQPSGLPGHSGCAGSYIRLVPGHDPRNSCAGRPCGWGAAAEPPAVRSTGAREVDGTAGAGAAEWGHGWMKRGSGGDGRWGRAMREVSSRWERSGKRRHGVVFMALGGMGGPAGGAGHAPVDARPACPDRRAGVVRVQYLVAPGCQQVPTSVARVRPVPLAVSLSQRVLVGARQGNRVRRGTTGAQGRAARVQTSCGERRRISHRSVGDEPPGPVLPNNGRWHRPILLQFHVLSSARTYQADRTFPSARQ